MYLHVLINIFFLRYSNWKSPSSSLWTQFKSQRQSSWRSWHFGCNYRWRVARQSRCYRFIHKKKKKSSGKKTSPDI